ncbi:MAG: histidine kinase [Flavobacteriales bacterium]|nr:histidine kinase [Flavobacteriales bacterium]
MESAHLVYAAHKAMGQTALALPPFELHVRMRDSLRNEEDRVEVARSNVRVVYQRKLVADSLQHASALGEVETARTIERLRADRNRNRAMGLGGGGILLVAGIGAYTVSDRKRRKARFEQQAAQLETKALRAQMDPHFLYNTLNSISSYIQEKDVDSAVSLPGPCGPSHASHLENSRSQEISLEHDLKAVDAYLHLSATAPMGVSTTPYGSTLAWTASRPWSLPWCYSHLSRTPSYTVFAQRATQGAIAIYAEVQGGKLLLRVEDNGRDDPLPP